MPATKRQLAKRRRELERRTVDERLLSDERLNDLKRAFLALDKHSLPLCKFFHIL